MAIPIALLEYVFILYLEVNSLKTIIKTAIQRQRMAKQHSNRNKQF